MPATTTNLFLIQDLQDGSRTGQLAESDLQALQAVADWITTFVVRPSARGAQNAHSGAV
jgi:hypothetical protein